MRYKCISCGWRGNVKVIDERVKVKSKLPNGETITGWKGEKYVECLNCHFRTLVNPFRKADEVIEKEEEEINRR